MLYLLLTCLVLHKSQFLSLTSDILHSLFQLNGFQIHSRIELRNVVNTAKSKGRNQRDGINPVKSLRIRLSKVIRVFAG